LEFQSDPPIHTHEHDVVMHELTIAVNIVELAEEEMMRHGGERVRAVHLQLGPLSGVAREALLFSYGLACEGTAAEGSSLVIEEGEGRVLDLVRMEIEP
jgi:Zn finger protein HypA/HybF involved in hydrogenase expression